jgi:hypothetical protein
MEPPMQRERDGAHSGRRQKDRKQGSSFLRHGHFKSLTGEWQKGSRAMHNILSKMKIKTGDVFLLWRMRHLVEEGKMELAGDPSKGWKEFEVKITSAPPQAIEEPLKTATRP